jgi:hypothetical protein
MESNDPSCDYCKVAFLAGCPVSLEAKWSYWSIDTCPTCLNNKTLFEKNHYMTTARTRLNAVHLKHADCGSCPSYAKCLTLDTVNV